LTNCTFTGNSINDGGSSVGGGAVAAGAGTLLRLVHCTVAGNLVGKGSAAAGIVSEATVQCHNCIISGNMGYTSNGSYYVPAEINFSPDTPRTGIPFGPISGSSNVDAQLGALALTTSSFPARRR